MKQYDLLIKNGQVVFPDCVKRNCNIAVKDGKIQAIDSAVDEASCEKVIDAAGLAVFPGGVDCHTHLGIYRPMDVDTRQETQSALVGGVTTMMTYFRTGQHYMNKTCSYHEIIPEVFEATEGNAYVDYCLHISPMTKDHIGEMEWLVTEQGITTFKYFMFYKGLNLAANSSKSEALSDSYDLGHLYLIMEEAARLSKKYDINLSVSVHCEDDELIKVFIERANAAGYKGLEAYHMARPALSESMATLKAATVANAAGATFNHLHIGSGGALETSKKLNTLYPNLAVNREVTLHALGLSFKELEGKGMGGKVNPPIRTPEDSEALWEAIEQGYVNWVGSDHACTPIEKKPDDLWPAACGFGGTSLMYPFMISEGYHKRGLSLSKIAKLVSTTPAQRHCAYPQKGVISVGSDADFAIVDLELEQTVETEMLLSAQEYTPFEGKCLKGWPVMTILGGQVMYENGVVVGAPTGKYVSRSPIAK